MRPPPDRIPTAIPLRDDKRCPDHAALMSTLNTLSNALENLVSSLNERCPEHTRQLKAEREKREELENDIHGRPDGVWATIDGISANAKTMQNIGIAIIVLLLGSLLQGAIFGGGSKEAKAASPKAATTEVAEEPLDATIEQRAEVANEVE